MNIVILIIVHELQDLLFFTIVYRPNNSLFFKITCGNVDYLFESNPSLNIFKNRDIEANNILLDADFEPRVADFGLARLISAYETHVSISLAGTCGYISPEYGQSWRSTTRGDIYSFGVILLELLMGKEPTRCDFKDYLEGRNLVEWARQMIRVGHGVEVLDPVVSNGPWKDNMLKVLHIANMCTVEDRVKRPSTLQVVKFLRDADGSSQLCKDFQ